MIMAQSIPRVPIPLSFRLLVHEMLIIPELTPSLYVRIGLNSNQTLCVTLRENDHSLLVTYIPELLCKSSVNYLFDCSHSH